MPTTEAWATTKDFMSTATSDTAQPIETTFEAGKDPYVLDPANIQDPPRTLLGRLRFLGPGMITSAAVVGSGELLTATTLGAKVGFMLFWLILISTFVKVWVQIELARWSISTGSLRKRASHSPSSFRLRSCFDRVSGIEFARSSNP